MKLLESRLVHQSVVTAIDLVTEYDQNSTITALYECKLDAPPPHSVRTEFSWVNKE